MPTRRWATFDCYGTLIDWNSGIRRELERLFGQEHAPRLLALHHELEPQVQAEDPWRSYRDVLALTLERAAAAERLPLADGDRYALAESLASWPPFPEVASALRGARDRGWRLAILSNTDRDLIESSKRTLGVPFDQTVVAEDIGSCKPAHAHWHEFFARTGADRSGHVHVAASVFHDIAPAEELELTTVWVNRTGERGNANPAREVRDLAMLGDVLDEVAR